MTRKAVSPVVAVVLLIGVAVSMGILVTTWVTHWVTVQTTGVSLSCAVDTNYIIESANYNSTGNNHLRLKITNKGERKIYGFGAVLDNGTLIMRLNSSDPLIEQFVINATNPLEREESEYIIIYLNGTEEEEDIMEYYTTFGSTLVEVRLLNDVCDSVSARTTVINQY